MNEQDEDKNLARWIRTATPIAKPSPERRAEAFEAVRTEWRAAVKSRSPSSSTSNTSPGSPALTITTQQRHRWWPAALAAGIVLAISVITPLSMNTPVIAQVAEVRGSDGLIRSSSGPRAWLGMTRPLATGEALRQGDIIETGADSPLRVSLAANLSLRISGETRLTLDSKDQFSLSRGALYIESSGENQESTPLVIDTPYGSVTHVGTRYLVEFKNELLRVLVREGLVRLNSANREPYLANAGTALKLDSQASLPELTEIESFDPAFSWLAAIPNPLDMHKLTLGRFLTWYELETGKRVIANNQGELPTPDISISGDLIGLSPDEALDVIALSSELNVNRQPGQTMVYPSP